MTTNADTIRFAASEELAQHLWSVRDEGDAIPRWLLRVISDDLVNRMVTREGSLRITLTMVKERPVATIDYTPGLRYADLTTARSRPVVLRSRLFVEQSVAFFSEWTRKRVAEEYWSLSVVSRNELLQNVPIEGGFRLWDGVNSAPLIEKRLPIAVRDSRIDPIVHHPMYEVNTPPIFGSY